MEVINTVQEKSRVKQIDEGAAVLMEEETTEKLASNDLNLVEARNKDLSNGGITENCEKNGERNGITTDNLPGSPQSRFDRQKIANEEEIIRSEQHKLQIERLEEVKQRARANSMEEVNNKKDANNNSGDTNLNIEEKLQVLKKQTQALLSESMANEKTSKKSKGGRGKKGRLSEEQEDKILLKHGDSTIHRTTRLTEQPSCIKNGTLRDYQLEGLNWLIKLYETNVNGILADEMGLGKTLQTISILAYLHEYRGIDGPHIIVVPKSTMGNWYKEFSKWCPSFNVLKLVGKKDERKEIIMESMLPMKFDVLLTSYEMVNIEIGSLTKINWQYLCIDEAHRIKNENSLLSKNIRRLDTRHRLLITGTPLQNNLHELWALLNFLLPDLFRDAAEFDNMFSEETLKEDRTSVVAKLHGILRPFLLRRLKIDVEKSLLPKKETKLFIGMTEMQKFWYKKMLKKDITALNSLGGAGRVQLLNILMQLKKVCNHPYLFEGAEVGPPFVDGPHLWLNSGKMVLLDKLLPKLKAQGSRVLIFSQMTRMLDVLEDYLNFKSFRYCRIDGQTDGELRDSQMDVYNAPGSEKFVFLLSTRAGGLGINLYTADTVILYDSDWNPQADLQAMDRAHRIGQKKQVNVYRFITEGSVEEKIVERAEKKLFLDAVVIQQGRLMTQNQKLSKNQLTQMVTFGADSIFSSDATSVTDADIDAILQYGQNRTEKDNEKLQKGMQHNLNSFSLDTQMESFYEFEGTDFSKVKKTKNAGGLGARNLSSLINLPQRERKKIYESEPKKSVTVPRERKPKGPVMLDFQFYNVERLSELNKEEDALSKVRIEKMAALKDLASRESKARRTAMTIAKKEHRARLAGEITDAGSEDKDPSGTGETEDQVSVAITPSDTCEHYIEAQKLKAEIETLKSEIDELKLSPEDAAAKDRLLSESFSSWGKNDFRKFISACESYGRNNTNDIFRVVNSHTGKDIDEISRYYDVFWSRYKEISDWERHLDRIVKGENKIQRFHEISNILKTKVGQYRDPFTSLTVHYGNKTSKPFTESEDKYLVCMMNELGYGQWDQLRLKIRSAWQFRFDWFIKSRTSAELGRRCDMLLRLIEKESASYDDTNSNNKNKRKKKNSSDVGGKKKPKLLD